MSSLSQQDVWGEIQVKQAWCCTAKLMGGWGFSMGWWVSWESSHIRCRTNKVCKAQKVIHSHHQAMSNILDLSRKAGYSLGESGWGTEWSWSIHRMRGSFFFSSFFMLSGVDRMRLLEGEVSSVPMFRDGTGSILFSSHCLQEASSDILQHTFLSFRQIFSYSSSLTNSTHSLLGSVRFIEHPLYSRHYSGC